MTYLRRSNPAEKKNRAKRLALAALVVIVFLVHIIFPSFFGRIFYPVLSVFWKSGTLVGDTVIHYATLVRSKKSLLRENIDLREREAEFQPTLLLLESLQKENESLKALLGRSEPSDMKLGVVLSRPPFSPYGSLIIDIGETEGVSVGDQVFASHDVVLGDIAEVYSSTAKVNLFSSPGRSVPVLVGDNSIQVEATGRGSGNFSAVLPSEIGIEAGDSVRLAGYKTNIFAVIEEVSIDSTDSLQTVLFKLPVNTSELSYVLVDVASSSRSR